MRMIRIVLVLSLLLALAGLSFAATSGDMSNQPMGSQNQTNQSTSVQNLRASVQPGPSVQRNMPASADIYVGGRLAMRIASSAGGMSPMERARIIADRLNESFAAGANWQNMKVSQMNGMWAVTLNGKMIATADSRSARAMGISSGNLANRWASQTVLAMGGQPRMIAMQLQPVQQRVAGSQQEAGVMWSTVNTKSVPLLNADTGNELGSVMVAGTSSALGTVNSVVVYQTTSNGATVWTFVPVVQATSSGTLTRVPGVGLVSVPTTMIPTSGLQTGNTMMQMSTQMNTQWNSAINTSLQQNSLAVGSATKIVPLYSTDMSQIIGAAQITGNAASVRQAQTALVSTNNDMYRFAVTTSKYAPTMGQPATLSDVVVSSIILMPQAGMPAPVMGQPGTAQPPATQPSTGVTAPPAGTLTPGGTAPEGGTTEEGEAGSGY